MSVATSQIDKASKHYWDRLWTTQPLPAAMNPRAPGLRNMSVRRFHGLFTQIFRGLDTRDKSLLEIGCARSVWLPYFAQEFGFAVSGMDYSENGCRQAERMLAREGVDGAVICADAFSPPNAVLAKFDVVVSFGVIEHFQDTKGVISAFAKCLKPGGLMLSLVPNMANLMGMIQRLADKAVFDIHVPLTRKSFAAAHVAAGLSVQFCNNFRFLELGVLQMERWRRNPLFRFCINIPCIAVGMVLGAMEGWVPFIRPNDFTSPYVVCLARKP